MLLALLLLKTLTDAPCPCAAHSCNVAHCTSFPSHLISPVHTSMSHTVICKGKPSRMAQGGEGPLWAGAPAAAAALPPAASPTRVPRAWATQGPRGGQRAPPRPARHPAPALRAVPPPCSGIAAPRQHGSIRALLVLLGPIGTLQAWMRAGKLAVRRLRRQWQPMHSASPGYSSATYREGHACDALAYSFASGRGHQGAACSLALQACTAKASAMAVPPAGECNQGSGESARPAR